MAQDDPIKVDLDKGSSKDFEIKTMADDLSKASASARQEPLTPPPSEVGVPLSPEPPVHQIPMSTPPVTSSSSSFVPPTGLPSDMRMQEEPSGPGWLRSFFVGFIVVLLLGIIGVAGWWWYGTRLAIVPPSPPPVTPPSISLASVLPTDKTVSVPLEAGDTTQDAFMKKLVIAIDTAKQGLVRDSIVKLDITQAGKELSLKDLGALAGVNFAQYTAGPNYQLVMAMPDSGPVLGLAISLSDSQATQNALMADEANLPGIANQVYSAYTHTALPKASSPTFLENMFSQVSIRYLNFPTPARSLDYAVTDNVLLVAGSRSMIFKLIDRIKVQSGLITPPASPTPSGLPVSPSPVANPAPSQSPTTP